MRRAPGEEVHHIVAGKNSLLHNIAVHIIFRASAGRSTTLLLIFRFEFVSVLEL